MTLDRRRQIEAVVEGALAHGEDERAAYLDAACAGDAELRRDVDSLLGGHAEAADLLESPPWQVPAEPLTPGTRLGPYEIQSAIGAGGMGEVYQATDTRLGRTVAIKVLPPDLASDPERRRRFEHEARAASALNHPHICTLYDLGDANPTNPQSPIPNPPSVSFLVLEYLDGQTLADRLKKGPLPVAQALELGAQIAEALGAAHRQGIVHRDLKPANVMLTKASTPNGSGVHVKLLDFGLAKLRAHGERPVLASPAAGPSASASLTARGEILGTWPYMAPEQVEGKPADARTDIWALGAVLYEMLTGARAFVGDTAASVVGAILERDPEPLATRRLETPPALDRLARKCLAKDPDARWQDARDVADELHWIRNTLEQGGRGQASIARLPWARTKLAGGAVSAAVVLVAATAWMIPRMMPAPGVQRYELTTTPAEGLRGPNPTELVMGLNRPSRTALAVSPDGQNLVFAGIQGTQTRLYRRRLSDETAVPLEGTEGAHCPFFSPDGAWVGFWAGGALRKVSIDGGFPIKLREMPPPSGGSWGAGNVIALAPQGGGEEGLTLVRATGGELVKILRPDSEGGEFGRYVLPHFLPDSDVLLVTWVRDSGFREDLSAVVAVSLTTDLRKTLVREAADARYLPTGHLAYVRSGRLEAVRFDPRRVAVTGDAILLLPDVMQAWNSGSTFIDTGAAQIAVSDRSGTLVYVTGGYIPDLRSRLVWVDRRGDIVDTLPPVGPLYAPQLSPEGDRIAYVTAGLRPGLWYLDLVRRTPIGIAIGDEPDPGWPRWYPDGRRLMFAGTVRGVRQQYQIAVGGRGAAEIVQPVPRAWSHYTGSWTPAGDELVYHCQRGGQPSALCRLWLDGATWERGLLLESKGSLNWPALSPDGRWLAYVSNETGTNEVYVRRYPSLEGQLRLSDDSGRAPLWSRDGRELFYPTEGSRHMMSVDVDPDAASPFGTPRMLFRIAEGLYTGSFAIPAYDVSLDGQRFLFVQRTLEPTPPPPSRLHVVLNWFEEVKAKAATIASR